MSNDGMNAASALSNLDEVITSLSSERAPDGTNTNTQFQIPEKFQGKSTEEIVKSYMELEAQQGKQGQELGELRKLADNFINQPTVSPTQGTTNPGSRIDINWDDLPEPEKVKAVLDAEMAPVRQELMLVRKERMESNLKQAHPDFVDVLRNPEFQKWVMGSNLRKEMFVRSDKQYDFEAANELFTTWKAINSQRQTQQNQERETAYNEGGMVTNSMTDAAPQRIYRRADLINLKISNPAAYARLGPEIDRAYADGRVR